MDDNVAPDRAGHGSDKDAVPGSIGCRWITRLPGKEDVVLSSCGKVLLIPNARRKRRVEADRECRYVEAVQGSIGDGDVETCIRGVGSRRRPRDVKAPQVVKDRGMTEALAGNWADDERRAPGPAAVPRNRDDRTPGLAPSHREDSLGRHGNRWHLVTHVRHRQVRGRGPARSTIVRSDRGGMLWHNTVTQSDHHLVVVCRDFRVQSAWIGGQDFYWR